uniref:Uncharacterized protein n=1 Tax=Klebsiella pneumoniae TaxID=573 RepID=A0A3G1IDZ1_KLEPN|nr:hypothetical protein pPUTH1_0133 [Klebsiella pneumoniae]UWM14742.1 hypothetical protein pA_gene0085 [Klebsiella pneumoniae]
MTNVIHLPLDLTKVLAGPPEFIDLPVQSGGYGI